MDSMASTTLIITLCRPLRASRSISSLSPHSTLRRSYSQVPKDLQRLCTRSPASSSATKPIPPCELTSDSEGHAGGRAIHLVHVYTNILRQMARVAAQLNINDEADEDIYRQLAIAIRQTHHLSHSTHPSTRTPLLEPADGHVSARCLLPGCTAVWEHALPISQGDNVSISIMLAWRVACRYPSCCYACHQKLHEDDIS